MHACLYGTGDKESTKWHQLAMLMQDA